jgi:hypothetical protein
VGKISLTELSSAFDVANGVDIVFSGTPFHGAEMVGETLLLPAQSSASGEKDNLSHLLQAPTTTNKIKAMT